MKDAIKKAIGNRKAELEKGIHLTIQIEPKDQDDEQKLKGSDLAPSVGDQDPSKKALQPALEEPTDQMHDADDALLSGASDVGEDSDPHSMIAKHLSQSPVGRGPMTLAERAHQKMKSLTKKA